MTTIDFLLSILFKLAGALFLLRAWLQLVKADFYNPASQFVVRLTHPIIGPLRRIIPPIGPLDSACLLMALIAIGAGLAVRLLLAGMEIPLPALLLAALLHPLSLTMDMLFSVLVGRAILSWFSQGYNPVERVLAQLTEPLLGPIRRLIPPIGGLDLSVMALLFLIYLLRYYLLPDLLGVRI